MSVWAIFRVKDEADIIEATVTRMLDQVDHVLVADNGSSDGTVEILESLPVELIHDDEVGFYQSYAVSALAERAREGGAEWVISADADELWFARTNMPLRSALSTLPAHVLVAEADLWDHVPTGLDPDVPVAVERIGWRRAQPAPLSKVACRTRPGLTIHQGNHGASYPDTDRPATVTGLLTIRHFALRSPDQMVRKARNGGAAYAATDLPGDVGAHWRGWAALTDEQIGDVFREFYWSADPEADGLVFDPAP